MSTSHVLPDTISHVLHTHAQRQPVLVQLEHHQNYLPLPGRDPDTRRQHQWNGHLIVSRMLLGWACGAFGSALPDGSNRGAHQVVPGREVAPRAG